MKKTSSLRLALAFGFVLGTAGGVVSQPAQGQQATSDEESDVIVILRDQVPDQPGVRGARHLREAAVGAAQDPFVADLQKAGAKNIRGFRLVNAVATRLSKTTVDSLTAHSSVQAIVPDLTLKRTPKRATGTGSTTSAAAQAASSPAVASKLCNTLEPEGLQLINAAFFDPSVPQAQQVRDGNGKPVTGRGVKIAFLADGMDPTILGFVHTDGSPVFVDYQNFTGDPTGTPTGGGEAFGDASSIAAQDMPNGQLLTFDISQFVNPAHPLPSPCNIRIRGVAPDASLVGLNVWSALGYTSMSTLIQAIEYAVLRDDVDVLNESLGQPYFPNGANDPLSLANEAAVRAGVTVTVASGDGGPQNTITSPAVVSDVITVGATTQFRLYAQTGSGVAPFSTVGYLDNNIAPFSSGGFAQWSPRTVDVVAPGDLGWALCSTNVAIYTSCYDMKGQPGSVMTMGGTSESAPFTAGEAAMVIQAYRSTHGGADPSPALVKQIIMSTATDLGAPASEQGAGLINALKAVTTALSLPDGRGGGRPVASSMLSSPNSIQITDRPNAPQARSVKITNTGSSVRHVRPVLQTLGPAFASGTMTLQLDPQTAPTFPAVWGYPEAYVMGTFTVPPGAQHLDAAIGYSMGDWPTWNSWPWVAFGVIDPSGRMANSLNEWFVCCTGFAQLDVIDPKPGLWKVVIWTRPLGDPQSYSGPVPFTWKAERYVNLGTVLPDSFELAPGDSKEILARFSMPSMPGDVGAAIRFIDASGKGLDSLGEVPLSLRSLIPIGSAGATWSGTLTGGNTWGSAASYTYEFDMPPGLRNAVLDVTFADKNYNLEGLLVDPQGMELALDANYDPTSGAPQYGLQLARYEPQSGRWHFILLQNQISSGNETSLPFDARIRFNVSQVSSAGLPNSRGTLLHVGVPITVPVSITNDAAATEMYFADARLDKIEKTALPLANAPVTLPGGYALYWVPTQVRQIEFKAQSSVPIMMDVNPLTGWNFGMTLSPDILAKPSGPDTVVASLSAPEVPFGQWVTGPALIGPFGADGAPPLTNVTTTATAWMKPFDTAVVADSGDLWPLFASGTSDFSSYTPLVLKPGQSGTIRVTITPPNQPGKTVSGSLYINRWLFTNTGNEMVRIPYTYTIAP